MTDMDKLGLGLDEIIRLDPKTNRRGVANRGLRVRAGQGSGSGFSARASAGIFRTSNPPATGRWKHDLFDDNKNRNRVGQRNTGMNSTTTLLISNLDFGVTTNDIQELFEDVGAVRVARVHYDESGRSLGTAEVVFERRVDAIAAQNNFNSVNLDGRPMDIKLVGTSSDQSSNRFSLVNGGTNRNQRAGLRNNIRANQMRTNKQQQNDTRRNKVEITAEDLDAELDAYRAESQKNK